MPKDRLNDLRDHLFETLEGLKDGSVDIGRAKAIAGVAQTIINSMTLEVRAANAINNMGETAKFAFLGDRKAMEAAPEPERKRLVGAPTVAPGEGIHAADPLLERKPEPKENKK